MGLSCRAAILIPAFLARRIAFAPIWMALLDQFNRVGHDFLRFTFPMRPEKRLGNFVLAQTTNYFFHNVAAN